MRKIKLTREKEAIIDNEDYKELSKVKWHFNSDGYARRGVKRNGKVTTYWMHREIMKTPKGMETDHINGNRLDNRKSNLRICTRAENLRNRKTNYNTFSGIKGAHWNKNSKMFHSSIKIKGQSIFLGQFKTKEEAGNVYKIKAQELFGAFAKV